MKRARLLLCLVAAQASLVAALAVADASSAGAPASIAGLPTYREATLGGERDVRRQLSRWREEGGAESHWWNVGGLVAGWSGLHGALNSDFIGSLVEGFNEWLTCLTNLVFVAAVAIGFATLPRRVGLLLGLIGIVAGPLCIAVGFSIFGYILAVAAYVPAVAVFALWLGAFTSSKVAQQLGIRLGLDADHDGDVDWNDLVYKILERISPQAAEDLQRSRSKRPTLRDVHERLAAIEALLVAQHEGGAKPTKPAVGSDPKSNPKLMV